MRVFSADVAGAEGDGDEEEAGGEEGDKGEEW